MCLLRDFAIKIGSIRCSSSFQSVFIRSSDVAMCCEVACCSPFDPNLQLKINPACSFSVDVNSSEEMTQALRAFCIRWEAFASQGSDVSVDIIGVCFSIRYDDVIDG